MVFFFFFNDTATTEIYTLSLHDALPISSHAGHLPGPGPAADAGPVRLALAGGRPGPALGEPGQPGPAGIHRAAVGHGCPGTAQASAVAAPGPGPAPPPSAVRAPRPLRPP